MKWFTILLCAAFLSSVDARSAYPAEYPVKPISVHIIYSPGGMADLGMRLVAEYAGNKGISMTVLNKPGGSGSVAALDVLKSRPDGYNVLDSATPLLTLPLMKNVGYSLDDFAPVASVSDMTLSFCVLASSGITTFREWMDRALAEPGKWNYGSPGAMSGQQMFMTALLKDKFPDANISHVPYQSGHEVNTALLGGHIKAAFVVTGSQKNYIDSGDFTLLAVTSEKRLPEFPHVPTFKELYGDKYFWASFHGLFVPKKTPKPVVEKLAAIVGEALTNAEVIRKFNKLGASANFRGPEEFAELLAAQRAFIKEVMRYMK